MYVRRTGGMITCSLSGIGKSSRRLTGDRPRAGETHVVPGGRLGELFKRVGRDPMLGARARPLPRGDVVADVVVDRLLDRDLETRLRLAALLWERMEKGEGRASASERKLGGRD